MTNFWINEVIKVVVFFLVTFSLGKWMVQRGVRVNYTRKIFHFTLFFFPLYLASIIPFESSIVTTLISGAVLLICLSTMCEPMRSRSNFLRVVFSSIDRPEDRPYTLIWAFTQLFATYIVIVAMVALLATYEKTVLIFITVLVAGIGDGLAEPVGVRFGKREYSVRALFTDKKYVRTIEGSACVFVSGLLAVMLLSEQLTHTQLLLSFLLIPITMTLAEAFSPHTWDGPFLYLSGGLMTALVLEVSRFIDGS